MKKLLTIMMFLSFCAPVMADVIDPHLTPADRAKIREQRLERYNARQRRIYLSNVCGNITSLDKKECKAKLKKEYEANLKLLEEYTKEMKNAEKNIKNASK